MHLGFMNSKPSLLHRISPIFYQRLIFIEVIKKIKLKKNKLKEGFNED